MVCELYLIFFFLKNSFALLPSPISAWLEKMWIIYHLWWLPITLRRSPNDFQPLADSEANAALWPGIYPSHAPLPTASWERLELLTWPFSPVQKGHPRSPGSCPQKAMAGGWSTSSLLPPLQSFPLWVSHNVPVPQDPHLPTGQSNNSIPWIGILPFPSHFPFLCLLICLHSDLYLRVFFWENLT